MVIQSYDRLLAAMGFDPNNTESRACFTPAIYLSVACAALPCLLYTWDADRSMSLALLPAVWCGWKISKPARAIDGWLLLWVVVAMAISTLFAPHAARALVMASAVGWVIAGGLVARNLAGCTSAVRLVLGGIALGSILGMALVIFGVGAKSMFFPAYWSARLFGAHQFAGCLATLALLVAPPSSRPMKLLVLAAAIIVWTGLAWSGSRAPALGLAVALMVWFWRGSPAERRLLLCWVPALSLVALALSYPLGVPYPQLGWWNAFTRTAQASGLESISSDRTRFWSITFEHALTSPWIGHGADSYLYIQPNQNGNQPHNALLQWFLEYGIFGVVPIVLLLLRGTRGLFASRPLPDMQGRPFQSWAAASLAGALVYGLFDGVFYHMIVFIPVAIFAGFAIGQHNPSGGANWGRHTHAAGRALLLAALAALLLHNWLCMMLLKGRNITPDSPPARILRVFPSTSHALRNWLNHWRKTHPDAVMPWVKWAEEAAPDQASYHVYAAQLYIWEKDYAAAEQEMLVCLKKAIPAERNDVLNVIATVRALAAGQPIPSTATPNTGSSAHE
jgi:O-antigen ligase